jgi:hypothetical protein
MVAHDAAANLQYGLQQVLARRKAGEAETTLVISKIATIRAKILGCGCGEIWRLFRPPRGIQMVAPRDIARNPCRAFVILQSSLSPGRGTFCGSSSYRESDPQFALRRTVAPLPIRRNQQHHNGHLTRTPAQQPRRASRTASCAPKRRTAAATRRLLTGRKRAKQARQRHTPTHWPLAHGRTQRCDRNHAPPARLLERPARDRKLFFCQIEALETSPEFQQECLQIVQQGSFEIRF